MGWSNRRILALAALALAAALLFGVFLAGALSETVAPLGFGDARALGAQAVFQSSGFDVTSFDFTQDQNPDMADVTSARLDALDARIPGAFGESLLREYYLSQSGLARMRLSLQKYYWLLGAADPFALDVFCDDAALAQAGFAAYFEKGRVVMAQKQEVTRRHPDAAARLGIAPAAPPASQLEMDRLFLESLSALCAGKPGAQEG